MITGRLLRTVALFLACGTLGALTTRAQWIDCQPGTFSVCQGALLTVSYTANGSFNAGNIFTCELSDANGSFASPVAIGTVTATTSGQVSCVTPLNTTPGTGYRVRVNASDPAVTGTQNAANITVLDAPNAGTDQVAELCDDQVPFQLFSSMTGADAGGTWLDPNGAAAGQVFIPGISPEGCYTYVVSSASCGTDSASLCINIEPAPDAGTDQTVTLCSNSDTIMMFDYLGGAPDPGGTWTDPNNTAHSGIFVPGVSVPGCYTYTVQGNPPCVDATATLCVFVDQQPQAGTDTSIVICPGEPPFMLFAMLGGNPQPGGSWSFNGAAHPPFFIPGTDPLGCYQYIVPGVAPCVSDTSLVCVSYGGGANAGQDALLVLCSNASPVDMTLALGGMPDLGGQWQDPLGQAHSPFFDPGIDPPGCYSYIVLGVNPCPNDTATLCITVNQAADAGIDDTTYICPSDPAFAMIGYLGGTPQLNGTWSFNGNPHPGIFVPGLDNEGCYLYTVQGMSPCADAMAMLCVIDSCLSVGLDPEHTDRSGMWITDGWNTAHPVVTIVREGSALLELIDASGRILSRSALGAGSPRTIQLDLSANGPGFYTLVLHHGTSRSVLRLLNE